MARLIVTSEDLGKGLKVENKKVVVDVANLDLPVDVHIDNVVYNQGTGELEFTFAGVKDPVTVELAGALGLNTKIQSFAQTPDTLELKITDTDNAEFTVDLTQTVNQLAQTVAQQAITDSIDTIVARARGEEVQSLGGVKLGHFVPAAN